LDNYEASRATAIARIRGEIDKLYREGICRGEDGFTRNLYPTSVTPGRGRFLGELCRRLKPTATLEIGMGWGLSTLHLLEAVLQNGELRNRHVIMDPYQSADYHNGALRVLREADAADLIEFYEELSALCLPRLIEQKRSFDFVFIDGDHRYDGLFVDLVLVDKLLVPGGVVAVDDTEIDAVNLACRFAETNWGYRAEGEHSDRPRHSVGRHRNRGSAYRPQIAAWRKPLEAVQRGQLHFVPFFADFSPYLRQTSLTTNRLGRDGLLALNRGDRAAARAAFREAIRLEPLRLRGYTRLARTYLPTALARALGGRSKHRLKPQAPPVRGV
jgi:predicted O-methyltransferase YrrM